MDTQTLNVIAADEEEQKQMTISESYLSKEATIENQQAPESQILHPHFNHVHAQVMNSINLTELMNDQVLPPNFFLKAPFSWTQKLYDQIEQSCSTHDSVQKTPIEKSNNNVSMDAQTSEFSSFRRNIQWIFSKIDILCMKDRKKCTRELLHNYFSYILNLDDQLCMIEKAFYDWFMSIYPTNHKSSLRLQGLPVELLVYLLQSKMFLSRFVPWYYVNKELIYRSYHSPHFRSKLLQYFEFLDPLIGFSVQHRLEVGSQGYSDILQSIKTQLCPFKATEQKQEELKPLDLGIWNHECGSIFKKYQRHKICERADDVLSQCQQASENLKLGSWQYMRMNVGRHFENALDTVQPKDLQTIPFEDKSALASNEITKSFVLEYNQLILQPKQANQARHEMIQAQNSITKHEESMSAGSSDIVMDGATNGKKQKIFQIQSGYSHHQYMQQHSDHQIQPNLVIPDQINHDFIQGKDSMKARYKQKLVKLIEVSPDLCLPCQDSIKKKRGHLNLVEEIMQFAQEYAEEYLKGHDLQRNNKHN